MKTANSISSIALGESIDKINRKKEERLIFEAAFIMLACMCRSSIQLTFTEVEFLESYPNYSYNVLGSSEFKSLLRFRNIVKIGMHLIPPVKNKDHLIDLVTRLVEGKLVKHISGSGATKETQRRTNIILTEGNLTINKRPPRKVVDSDAAASGDDDEITITKKRKSQTGEHAQQKLAKKSSEKGEKPPKRRYKKRSASPVSFPPSIMYSSAAVLPGSPTAKVIDPLQLFGQSSDSADGGGLMLLASSAGASTGLYDILSSSIASSASNSNNDNAAEENVLLEGEGDCD